MKRPTLYVKALPNLYKHCTSVKVLHIDLLNLGIQEEESFVESYLNYVKNQMYATIERNNVTALANLVQFNGESYVIFKSNIDKKLLLDALYALFAELDQHCDRNVESSYQFMDAMICEEGRAAGLFKVNKVGDSVQSEELHRTSTIKYDGKAKPRGKLLLTIEEYRPLYENLNKFKPKPIPKAPTKTIVVNDALEDCEYYI